MTDEEKQALRDAKMYASETLGRKYLTYEDKLTSIEPRLWEYVNAVSEDTDGHNVFEVLEVLRFLDFLDKYKFSKGAMLSVVTCFEMLKFPTKKGMKPLTLTPIQIFSIAGIYGFLTEEKRRLTSKVMLFVPRKFGKTTFSSGLCIYEFIFGPADGQVYTCANSYNQAKICFDNIRSSLKMLDQGRDFTVNREAIYCNIPGRTSFMRCLAADETTLDGLNASVYIMDEFAQAKTSGLRNVMSTSQGARENPMEIIITTGSDLLDGPCAATLEAYKKILLGKMSDDSVFPLILMPDVDDEDGDPHTWHKVQPNLGYTVQSNYYAKKWDDAQLTADDMLAFRTKLLNKFVVNDEKQWITADEVTRLFSTNCKPTKDVWPKPPLTMVSFDLSVWDDFSCVCYSMYDQYEKKFRFYLDYYIPEETIDRHPYRDIYRQWVADGYLKILPGKTIDYGRIVNDIISHNGAVLIAGIGYDPYKSKEAVNLLKASRAAKVLHPCKQTYGSFTGSVETVEGMVKNGNCLFDNNPITAWCFGNCLIDEDNNGNRKPIKSKQQMKIDGAICVLMCIDQFNSFGK